MKQIKFLYKSKFFNADIEKILEEYFSSGKISQGEIKITKDNNVRRILIIEIPNGTSLILKGYKKGGLLKSLKEFLFGLEGQRELFNLNKLKEVNTPRALCLFKIIPRHDNIKFTHWLCLEKIENVKTLKEILLADCVDTKSQSAETLFPKDIKRILQKTAFFVTDFLNKGIFHKDIHCGNILVSSDDNFFLLDAKEITFYKAMPLKKRLQTCAMLAYSISFIKNSYWSFRFIKALYEKDDLSNSIYTFKLFLKTVLQLMAKKREQHSKSRVKKSIGNSFGSTKLKFDDLNLVVKNKFSSDSLLTTLIMSIYTQRSDSSIVKTITKQTDSRRIGYLSLNGAEKTFFKEHSYNYLKGLVKKILGSHSRKEWCAIEGLKLRDFPVAENFLFIERHKHLTVRKDILYVEFLDGLPIPEFVKQNFKKKFFLLTLARFVKKLHDYGIFHKDLKANNIIVKETPDTLKFYLVDLDRVHFKKKLKEKEKIKNLAQLNASISDIISKTDRLFFLKKYLSKKFNRNELRKLVNKIMNLTIKRKHFWP